MTSEVVAHYEGLLAEHYGWMLGDFDQLVADDRRLLDRHLPAGSARDRGTALDLGCGSGVQSIAVAVCLGDTLPHLPDRAAVRRLFDDAFTALVPDGIALLGFRDLSTPLIGLDRFIPVRSDRDRIMTCFLEDEGDPVRVHDLIHTTDGPGGWQLAKSSYCKLRLPPDWVVDQLGDAGFSSITVEPGPRGTCLISARRPTQELP